MSEAIPLRATGLVHRYNGQRVLRGVDLELHPGEVVALLGPNGAGKTTLMSILVGLLKPQEGLVRGDIRTFGWVPQGRSTYPRLTVRENLELFARLQGLGKGAAAATARRAAHEADLEPWFGHCAWQLSGGLRQRLNVAIGLLEDPQVVILDEPTTGVDLLHRTAMWEVLRARARHGSAVLYSTHSLEDAGIADRAIVLVAGQVVWSGPLPQLATYAPEAPASAAYVADPVARGLLALWAASGEREVLSAGGGAR